MPSAKTKEVIKKPKAKKPVRTKKVSATPAQETPALSWYYETKNTEITKPQSVKFQRPSLENTEPPHEEPPRQTSTVATQRPSWRCILNAIAIFLFPFIALPGLFSIYDLPKQIFLTLITTVGIIVVAAELLKKKTFDFFPKHIFVPLGFIALIIAAVSASRSGVPYQGFIGYGGTESLSVLTFLLLGLWILLMFTAGRETVRLPMYALIASGSILSLITFLSLSGLNLYRFVNISGFNPTGTTTGATLIAVLTIIISVSELLGSENKKKRLVFGIAILPPLLLLLGSTLRLPWIVLALGLGGLIILTIVEKKATLRTSTLIVLCGAIAATLLAVFNPSIISLPTPLEVSPSHGETWSIVKQTLKEAPLLGSGPTSFSVDYLRFRSLPILKTPFWNVSFDWGSSAVLTWFATVGIVGAGLIILAILTILFSCIRKIHSSEPHLRSLCAGACTLLVAAFLSPLPITQLFFFGTILGLILALVSKPVIVKEKWGATALVAILIIAGIFVQVRHTLAEFIASKGVQTAAASSLLQGEDYLKRATNLDNYNDQYLRFLAETRRLILQQKLSTTPPSNDQQAAVQEIHDLASLAIDAAKMASKRAPQNAANWISLGGIYLDISPITDGAPEAAIEAFEKAEKLSPSDPMILVNLGVARAIASQKQQNEELSGSAKENLLRAATLRPSYPSAHIELARLLGRSGQTDEATSAYYRAQSLVPNDPALRFEIGLFLLQNSKIDEAQKEFEEAVRLEKNFSNARWFLAQVYEQKGEIAKAVAEVQKIVELNPENQQAKERLTQLQEKLEVKE